MPEGCEQGGALEDAGEGVAGRSRVLLVSIEEVGPAAPQGHLPPGHDILVHLGVPGRGATSRNSSSPSEGTKCHQGQWVRCSALDRVQGGDRRMVKRGREM